MNDQTPKTVSELNNEKFTKAVLEVYDECLRKTGTPDQAFQLCTLICTFRYGDAGRQHQG